LAMKIKVMSLGDVITDIHKKAEEAAKEFKENGGMCLNCGKNPGNPKNNFNCDECQKEAEEILKQLRGPGFHEFRV